MINIKNVQVGAIFPLPIRNFKLESLTEDVIQQTIDTIENKVELYHETKEPVGAWSYSQAFLDEHEFLKDVKEEVLEAFDMFSKLEKHECKDIRIASSWVNRLNKSEHILPHRHPNCYIAGTIHLTPGSPLVFQKPTTKDWYDIEFEEDHTLEINQLPVPVEAGHLILFPSKLVHGVLPHTEDAPRYSIGINSLPRVYGRSTAFVNLTDQPIQTIMKED